ncbi:MAG: TolC family protein [Prevotellaceae bacterium]|jgi:outer membrane protein TolC|nr:TolC family protein [Prevotellaceae bacterium]
MLFFKKHFLLSLALLTGAVLHAQKTKEAKEVFDLQRCVEQAIERNFDVKISRNRADAAANNASPGNAGYLPTVDGNAGYSGTFNNFQNTYSRTGADAKYDNNHTGSYNLGVGLTWKIFDGFNMSATLSRYKDLQQIGELSTKLSVEQLVAEVTAMYYDVVQRKIRMKNLRQSLDLSRFRLRIAQEQFYYGSRSRIEVLQAEADFNADSSTYATYAEGIKQLKIRLKEKLQVPFNQAIYVQDTMLTVQRNLELATLEQLATLNNTSLKIYDKNRDVSAQERKQVEAGRYPYLNFNAGYGYSGNSYSTGSNTRYENLGFNYGLTLGIKIYDGSNQRRMERNAVLEQKNRELEYEHQQLQVQTDLQQLYSNYLHYINLLQLEQHNKDLAEQKVDLAMEQYKHGQLTSIGLREFQRTLLDAQDRVVNALYQTKYAEIYLMQLCGMSQIYMEPS